MMAVVFEMTLSEGAFTRDAAFVPVYSLLRNYSVLRALLCRLTTNFWGTNNDSVLHSN
jgi:hypothetical protein